MANPHNRKGLFMALNSFSERRVIGCFPLFPTIPWPHLPLNDKIPHPSTLSGIRTLCPSLPSARARLGCLQTICLLSSKIGEFIVRFHGDHEADREGMWGRARNGEKALSRELKRGYGSDVLTTCSQKGTSNQPGRCAAAHDICNM